MTLTDKTGAQVHVENTGQGTARTAVSIFIDGNNQPVGHAFYVDNPQNSSERIFYHTEVDEAFGGRGLAGILVRQSLEQAQENNLTVVPLCPLFKSHLDKHDEEYTEGGGAFRPATSKDITLVESALS